MDIHDYSGSARPGCRNIAVFPGADGARVRVWISPGSEIFIGRFARLDAFRGGDGIISFHDRACLARR